MHRNLTRTLGVTRALAVLALAGASLATATTLAEAGWVRSGGGSGPYGRSWSSSGSGGCYGGSCSSNQAFTGPNGNTATRSGSTNCAGGTCNHSATVNGPRGTTTRNSTWTRY